MTLQQLRDIAQQTLADGRSLVLAADSGEPRPGRRPTGRRRPPVTEFNFDQDL